MASSTTHVRGLESALSTLKQIDPVLVRQAQKRLKDDAKPMVGEARGSIPSSPPLSRWVVPKHGGLTDLARGHQVRYQGGSRMPVWDSGGAKRKIAVIVRRQRVKGFTGRRALVALRQNDAAGQVFDVAGRRNANVFGNNLTKTWRSPSRYMWPAVEKHRETVKVSITRAKFDMEEIINAELRARGYHPTTARGIASGRIPMGGRV